MKKGLSVMHVVCGACGFPFIVAESNRCEVCALLTDTRARLRTAISIEQVDADRSMGGFWRVCVAAYPLKEVFATEADAEERAEWIRGRLAARLDTKGGGDHGGE
jgi:hypothetical protein